MWTEKMELIPLPKIHVNSKLKYNGNTATVIGCWWDEECWRYELYISRGKNKGYWSVREGSLVNGITKHRS
jgi:hypothetical protein